MRFLWIITILCFPLVAMATQNEGAEHNNIEIDNVSAADEIKISEKSEIVDVFSPKFMNTLRQCKPSEEVDEHDEAKEKLQVIGSENGKCHLQYADFDLWLPFDILPSIHGFDDLIILLRNPEIAQYNYKPQYIYDGLLHALNACAKGNDYLGIEKKQKIDDKLIIQGLEAQFYQDVCTVYLLSMLEIAGLKKDYTVTCRIKAPIVSELVNYYSELLDKYGEKRIVVKGKIYVQSEQQNEQTHQADNELMYILQQKGFCE